MVGSLKFESLGLIKSCPAVGGGWKSLFTGDKTWVLIFIGENRFDPNYCLDYLELLLKFALDLALIRSAVSKEELIILL